MPPMKANQLTKVSKWISKMKSLIPKLSRIEAGRLTSASGAQNWYNQEAHARAMGEASVGTVSNLMKSRSIDI